MKGYIQRKIERTMNNCKRSAFAAKLAEGTDVRSEAVRAFRTPPYYMKKGKKVGQEESNMDD